MIFLELKHTDNKTLLRNLAALAGTAYKGEDFIQLHPPTGTGIIKVIDLAEELQVLLADVTLYRHLLASRASADKRYYILHFEDVQVTGTVTFSVDGDTLQKKQTRHAVVRLTSNVFSNTEEITANTPVKAVKVFFSEDWLQKYLGLGEEVDVLQEYVLLKTASFDMEPLDAEYLRLMDELWNTRKEDPLQNIFLQNRVTLMIERFFTRLATRVKELAGKPFITDDEMHRLVKVERMLVHDLAETPPAISELARMAAMSATKLKKHFRGVYGSSIYAYYQQARLQKAKELLLSGQHSVQQTARQLGFHSAANFSIAFKKQFHTLPSAIIRQS